MLAAHLTITQTTPANCQPMIPSVNPKIKHILLFLASLLAVLVGLAASPLYPEQPATASGSSWLHDLKTAQAIAHNPTKPIYVHVYADWCPNCKTLKKTVYPSAGIAPLLESYVKVEINGERDPDFASRYQIRGYPTLLFMDPNGYILSKVEGSLTHSRLKELLERNLKLANLEEQLLRQKTAQPDAAAPAFRLGVYYSEIDRHRQARELFLFVWRRPVNPENQPYRGDAIFNAAVSSMELGEYSAAAEQWSNYIDFKEVQDEDFASARLYRGISLVELGERKRAVEDLQYARNRLLSPAGKKIAERYLLRAQS